MSRSGRQVSGSRAGAYAGRVPDLLAWLRRHPWQADGLLALLLAAMSAGQWQWQGQTPNATPAAVTAVSVLMAATTNIATGYRRRGTTVAASSTLTAATAAGSWPCH